MVLRRVKLISVSIRILVWYRNIRLYYFVGNPHYIKELYVRSISDISIFIYCLRSYQERNLSCCPKLSLPVFPSAVINQYTCKLK